MKIKFAIIFSIVVVASALFFGTQKPGMAAANLIVTSTLESEANTTTTMQFFGDIMMDRNVAKAMGRNDLGYIFANVSTTNFIHPQYFTVANLEGPFAKARVVTTKSIAFRFDPKFAVQLKTLGFDAFNLANNHSYDMGVKNVVFTRQTLAAAGLGYFGDELHEGEAYTLVVTTSAKLAEPVAFLGIHNTYHELDLKKVALALEAAKKQARIIIVNVHWGQEYQRISNTKQRTLAHWFIDHGASAVIGHHPHVIEEAEVYKGAPIFYSLGNFIFDQYFSKDTQEGLSVVVSADSGKITAVELKPIYSVKSQVFPMTRERRTEFLDWMNKNSRLGDKKFVDGILFL